MKGVWRLVAAVAFLAACAPVEARPGPLTRISEAPVLAAGPPGAWDSASVHAPCVLKIGSRYVLWYDGTGGVDLYRGWSIGRAESPDGIRWERDAAPVLTPGPPAAWDSVSVHDPRVVREGETYRMWYSGFDGRSWRIGLASSGDGRRWDRHPANPVLSPGPDGAWDAAAVAYSSVEREPGGYRMWYQGQDQRGVWRIGAAASPDGVAWTKDERNPLLGLGAAGAWDAERVFTPATDLKHAPSLLWYTGGPMWGIGAALIGQDGRPARLESNPLLRPGAPGAWDAEQVLTLSVLRDGDQFKVWYGGGAGGRYAIGLAAEPIAP
ncbi:MAG: hypothetical protein NTZ05_06765 [Chloroflexi bacterium]|nr:hypothetical protein [Chloroflexota bacterium]